MDDWLLIWMEIEVLSANALSCLWHVSHSVASLVLPLVHDGQTSGLRVVLAALMTIALNS